jgi:ribosomal protein S18 acetylase RimI-like enzyme
MISHGSYDRHSGFEIKIMEQGDIPSAAKIHKEVIGFSLNSKLGLDHLRNLYEVTLKDPYSSIYVAHRENHVVGVAVATLDPDHLQKKLLHHFTLTKKLRIIIRLLSLNSAVIFKGKSVVPCLFVLAVDNDYRRAGLGRLLLENVEQFMRNNNCYTYQANAIEGNNVARKFYIKLGFIEVEKRGRHTVYVKELSHNA